MAKYEFSDGLHFVRPASEKDRHPLKWVVRSHRGVKPHSLRRAVSPEEAIETAKRLSEKAEKPETPAAVVTSTTKNTPGALEAFSSSYFTCICANPVAQVWQCTTLPGEKKTAGRPAKDGSRQRALPSFSHSKGDCAVLLGQTPVREPDGSIRVFPNWQGAEEYAYDLYCQADELGETITWREGNLVVDRLTNVEIIYDPATNGAYRPFSLWFPKYSKPYYMQVGRGKGNRSSSAKKTDGTALDITSLDPDGQRAYSFNRLIDKMAAEEEQRQDMTMQIATYRTIWEAEKQALALERDYFHNADYMN